MFKKSMPILVSILLTFVSICILASLFYKNVSNSSSSTEMYTTEESENLKVDRVRIIDNYELISDKYGVPVEFWYNETLPDAQYQSSPGCPQSIDGYPWVYYGFPPKCFLVSFGGSCDSDQKITMQTGSLYGICACDCFVENAKYNLFLPALSDRYIECVNQEHTSKIYDKKGERCYSKFERGPCSKGEVIANSTGSMLICLPTCNYSEENWAELRKLGLCVEVPRTPYAGTTPIRRGDCPEGQRYSFLLKKCTRSFEGGGIVG